jgi:hypothetical protein
MRQRQKKHELRVKNERNATSRADKAFAATLLHDSKKGYPHMEWDGSMFIPQPPAPSPEIRVNASIMHSAHQKLGLRWSGSRKSAYKPRSVDAIADTGCQTCTAGIDFLEEIGCPQSYLVPTSHRIIGITAASLGIIGAVMLRLEYDGQVTRQMVHISVHAKGLYMSRTACEDLKLISADFPRPSRYILTSTRASASSTKPLCPGGCNADENSPPCPNRTNTPDRPTSLPFPPTEENKEKLKAWFLNSLAGSAFNMCTDQKLKKITGTPLKIVLTSNGLYGPTNG